MSQKNDTISKRKLGKTNLKISPIGQGVMQFAGGHTFMKFLYPELEDEIAKSIIKAALDNNINWFDTAEAYGSGISETKLSKGLQAAGKSDKDIVIATKWSPIFRRAKSITKTIDDRLKYLEPYSIDLHQIHNPMSVSSLKKQLYGMVKLIENGKIKSIGISNFSADKMREAHDVLAEMGIPLASNQVNYSLVHRNIESNGVLETAKELGITIIAWSPLQMGVLTGIFHFEPDVLKSKLMGKRIMIKRYLNKSLELVKEMDIIAKNHQATISQVALNWLVNYHGETVVAIPGATKPKHAEENGKAMRIELTKTEMDDIEALSRDFL